MILFSQGGAYMDNILKDLYFGRYAAFERKYEPNGDHADAIEKVVNLEEALEIGRAHV